MRLSDKKKLKGEVSSSNPRFIFNAKSPIKIKKKTIDFFKKTDRSSYFLL